MKILLLFLILLVPLYAKDNTSSLNSVYYLDTKTYTWKGPADIHWKGNKITEISQVNTKAKGYLSPSFCDAQVTLGMNSLGGSSKKEDVELALESLLAHGFTKAYSHFDPPWVQKHYQELLKKKKRLPKVIFADKPILPETKEYTELPKEIYFSSNRKATLLKEAQRQSTNSLPVLLIHRYHTNNTEHWNSKDFYKLLSTGTNKRFVISAFADRVSILDAMLAGIKYLQHPIPTSIQNSLKPEHLNNLHWMPLFNIYKNLNRMEENESQKAVERLAKLSPFYKKHYYNKIKDFSFEFTENSDYSDYMLFLENHPDLLENMILGSGSGNLFSFPGISGLEELEILLEHSNKNPKALKTLIHNSCKYMGQLDNPEISIGKEASFILFRANPLEDPENIYKIDTVFLEGQTNKN
jgi:hypothetical protein